MCIDTSDDIVTKYNNTYCRPTKMKPVDVKPSTYIYSSKNLMVKILNLELVILLEYQNIKRLLQKALFQIGLKKIFLLEKLKILFREHMLLVILNAKRLLERFIKKNFKKTNKKEFRMKKVIKKVINYILNGKSAIIRLIPGSIKKVIV